MTMSVRFRVNSPRWDRIVGMFGGMAQEAGVNCIEVKKRTFAIELTTALDNTGLAVLRLRLAV